MNIHNINAAAGSSEKRERARVDQSHSEQQVPQGPHSINKLRAEQIRSNLREMSLNFQEIAELRPKVVKEAILKLDQGEFNNPEVILQTAKAILGESPSQ